MSQFKLTWKNKFPVIGKGTFLFNVKRYCKFRIVVRRVPRHTKIDNTTIELNVGNEEAVLVCNYNNKSIPYYADKPHPIFEDNIGFEKDQYCTYWLSYDSDRMIVKYGKGYRMDETTILTQNFNNSLDKKEIKDAFFGPRDSRMVEIHDVFIGNNSKEDLEPVVDFDHLPFVSNRPPIVVDSSLVNMFELDKGQLTYSASLPKECLELYKNVTAKNVDLGFMEENTCPGFKLVDAIGKSIQTKGALLYTILEGKKAFGDNETYLRITLGYEQGNSPGVPYVLEIWPSKHGSPIHNHGNAYAVIRVLYGELTIKVYNKNPERKSEKKKGFLFDFNVKKDDVTWISPNWYQTHQLWNNTGDFCATIQCYQYGQNDNTHWPFFDYISSCDQMQEFEPNSDLTFTEMVNKLKKEYQEEIST